MDSMLKHPGTELQALIKEKGLTQKAFASILGKKVSEVNELLKGKRNITIQRDYLLHQTLGTPIKYWILKQVDYDYSLLDIEEIDDLSSGASAKNLKGERDESNTQDSSSQTPQNDNIMQTNPSEHSEESIDVNSSSGASANDLRGETDKSNTQDSSSLLSSEGQKTDDEDLKNRANIFRSF